MTRQRFVRTLLISLFVGSGVLAVSPAATAQERSAENFEVDIVRPPAQVPAFGTIEVLVEISSSAPVQSVDCFVDGRRLGRLHKPPFRWVVDVGEDNEERVIEIEARSVLGTAARAERRTPRIEVDEVLTVELLQLYAVVERRGERVTNLGESAFRLFNDQGKRQEIVTFEGGDLPISAALLVDSSESMSGRRLEAALDGVRTFAAGLREDDEAMLVQFSDRILALTPFTNEASELEGEIQSVRARGSTALNDHLFFALNRVDARLGRRVIVLLSDGDDITSLLSMKEVLLRARRSQAVVYWILLDESEEGREGDVRRFSSSWRDADGNAEEQKLLRQAVSDSGGRIQTIRRLEDLEQGFADIMAELRDQYVIGFYPTDRRYDGSWRRYRVRVQGGYDVRSRGGFID